MKWRIVVVVTDRVAVWLLAASVGAFSGAAVCAGPARAVEHLARVLFGS